MKNNKRKKIAIVVIILLLLSSSLFIFKEISPKVLKGDSGFDTSYDSGSSYSSGSSSYNSSYGSGSSSSGGSNLSLKDIYSAPNTFHNVLAKIFYTLMYLIFGSIFFGPLIAIIYIFVKYNKNNSKEDYDTFILLDEDVKKYIPNYNKEKFMNDRFEDYVKVQNAWMTFDYDVLRSMLTDELYNQYVMQLDTLKVKNEKNVMSDFVYKDGYVTNIKSENNTLIITLELEVEFYDYIEKDGKVVRGSKKRKITQHYGMTFVCNISEKLDKCPNCGAKLNNNASNKCESCGSIVTGLSDKWVLSKKESWYQK